MVIRTEAPESMIQGVDLMGKEEKTLGWLPACVT